MYIADTVIQKIVATYICAVMVTNKIMVRGASNG